MKEKFDYLDPLFITAAIIGIFSDFILIFGLLGILIPVLGMVLFLGSIAIHFFVGLLFIPIILKLNHFVPKLILIAAIIIPLPLLSLGLALSILAQNRIVELVLTQAVLAVATGGAGNVATVAGSAATTAKGAQTASLATKGAETVSTTSQGIKATENISRTARTEQGASRAERIRKGLENKLREHSKNLEEELSEENNQGSEEDFGIKESTDKTQEMFRPEYKTKPEEEAEEDDITKRKEFEAKKEQESQERRSRMYGSGSPETKREEGHYGGVDINEDTNEVNLKE